MAGFSTLQDMLTATVLNTGLWTQFTAASGTCTYSGLGASMNYPTPTSTTNDADIATSTTYELTNDAVFVNVPSAPSGTNSDANFRLKIDATNYIQWQQEGTTLLGTSVVGGVQTIRINLTYNSTVHRWWRIREGTGGQGGGTAGTTYWDTSVDGLTWTQRASATNPIAVTALTLQFAAVSFGADSNLKPLTLRYLNIPVSEGNYNHVRAGNGMSVSEVAN